MSQHLNSSKSAHMKSPTNSSLVLMGFNDDNKKTLSSKLFCPDNIAFPRMGCPTSISSTAALVGQLRSNFRLHSNSAILLFACVLFFLLWVYVIGFAVFRFMLSAGNCSLSRAGDHVWSGSNQPRLLGLCQKGKSSLLFFFSISRCVLVKMRRWFWRILNLFLTMDESDSHQIPTPFKLTWCQTDTSGLYCRGKQICRRYPSLLHELHTIPSGLLGFCCILQLFQGQEGK